MQEQFTYRELSEKLNINLAKLKRWSREFLPPDYSAGQSQGVARILSIDEAFSLFLAGHLVSTLRYSIPETKKIMDLLIPYLKEKKILPSLLSIKEFAKNNWEIRIKYFSEFNEASLVSEITISKIIHKKKIMHKKIGNARNEFLILRHKEEEHKIIEEVSRSKKYQDLVFLSCDSKNKEKLSDEFVNSKSLYFSTVIFMFLTYVRGFEFVEQHLYESNTVFL